MDYVQYIRVSTKRQGESGLGLESQKEILNHYIDGYTVETFIEVQSGGDDERSDGGDSYIIRGNFPPHLKYRHLQHKQIHSFWTSLSPGFLIASIHSNKTTYIYVTGYLPACNNSTILFNPQSL